MNMELEMVVRDLVDSGAFTRNEAEYIAAEIIDGALDERGTI